MEPQAHGYLPPVSIRKSKQATLEGMLGPLLLGLEVRYREHLAQGLAPQPENRQHPRCVSRQLVTTGFEQDCHMLPGENISISRESLTESVCGCHIHEMHIEKLRGILNPIPREAAHGLQA